MAKREISNLDLKIKLSAEYLSNGGVEKIWDAELLQDMLDVRFDYEGKADPDTVTVRLNAFMQVLLADQMSPPFYSPDFISEYQSTLQKSNCFDQQNIDTEEQFDEVYQIYKEKTDYLFRGQGEAKWRLYSKLQRFWILDKLHEKFDNYEALLRRMVDIGRTEFKDKILEILQEKHDDADNDIAILSFLQHYSCPTPLLDWTYRFQNALFFALDGIVTSESTREIEEYFSVYFIEEKDFESGGMRKLMYGSIDNLQEFALHTLIEQIEQDEEARSKMKEHFKGRKAIDIKRIKGSGMIAYLTKVEHMMSFPATYFADNGTHEDIVFSLNNSANIKSQQGVFTWNADPAKPFEMVVGEQNNEGKQLGEEEQHVLCMCFNIKKSLAEHVKKRLEEDRISRELIYPTPELSTWEVFEKALNQ